MSYTCETCDTLPAPLSGATSIYFWPPQPHTQAKLQRAAKRIGGFTRIDGGICVPVSDDNLGRLFQEIEESLTLSEQTDTRCLTGDLESGPPTMADFAKVTSLRRALALHGARWLRDVLAEDRLDTLFQPIVHARQTNRPFAHECLLRWRDETGRLTAPGKLFDTARDADLLFQLDRKAREVNIRNAARADVRSRIFVNFTPSSIYDPVNCLRATMAIIDEERIEPDRVVFEIIETDKVQDMDHLKSILDYYKDHGFGVALDDLGAGHSTLPVLGALRPDYVKLDMGMVRDVHLDRFKSEMLKRVIELSQQFNIKVVAEGIEVVEEASWLISQGVDYLQGYYFQRPQETPVTILERRDL